MKKSRHIIKNTTILILVLIFAIFFLESNIFIEIRNLVSLKIGFFEGRREFFSNVLIGILGSALILFFGELLNYFQEKQMLEFRILELYQKWDRTIKYKDQDISKNIHHLNYIAVKIRTFGQEVDIVYNNYLPYHRSGKYFKLIRILYQYTNTVMKYLDKSEFERNQRMYLIHCIKYNEQLKKEKHDPKIISKIEELIALYNKQLAILDKDTINESTILKDINKKRFEVEKNYTNANFLILTSEMNNLDETDRISEFERDMHKIRKSMRKIKRKEFFYKLTSFTQKIYTYWKCKQLFIKNK